MSALSMRGAFLDQSVSIEMTNAHRLVRVFNVLFAQIAATRHRGVLGVQYHGEKGE